jgi:nicotinic acid mononucleotide adenylyltransferase
MNRNCVIRIFKHALLRKRGYRRPDSSFLVVSQYSHSDTPQNAQQYVATGGQTTQQQLTLIDTLEALMAEQAGSVLFLVIGGDQLAAFNQWRRWQDILKIATVCVAQRLPQRGKSAHPVDRPSALPDFLPLEFPAMPVSATEIRLRLAAQGREPGSVPADLQGLIPQDVAAYISQHMLYQSNPIIP